MDRIRIGTRDSQLAVAQAELLKKHLESRHPHMEVLLVKMKTICFWRHSWQMHAFTSGLSVAASTKAVPAGREQMDF